MITLVSAILAGCQSGADIASRNLAKAAEQCEITRRIVFFNGITDTYLLSIEGFFSITDKQLEVTCKIGLGLSKKTPFRAI